jgi:HAD superfamily hydrolase (TIGR01509 family)
MITSRVVRSCLTTQPSPRYSPSKYEYDSGSGDSHDTNTCSLMGRTERLQSPGDPVPGDWSNGHDGGLQNRRLGFDSLVPRLIQAVIFDLDGLLLDSESAWDGGRRALVGEHGLEWPPGATEAMLGMSSPEWSRYVRDQLGVPLEPPEISDRVVAHVLETYAERLPLLPGAEAAVTRIAERWPLALASSSNKEVIEQVMETSGWDGVFKAWVSSEEVARGKPAPDVFLEAARRIGVDPGDAAGVEDSHNGILAARAAGLRVVAIPNHEFPPGEEALRAADAVLGSLGELTPAVVDG